jgi:hypothetical protein
MIRIILKSKEVLSEAAMAERYTREELHKIFPDIKKNVENFYLTREKGVKTYEYKLEIKDPMEPHVIPTYISLKRSGKSNGPYRGGGSYGPEEYPKPDPAEKNPKTGDIVGVLRITVSLPDISFKTDADLKKTLDKRWSELHNLVRSVLVHELIHKGQGDKMMGFATRDLKSKPNADFREAKIDARTMNDLQDFFRYLEPRDPVAAMNRLMPKLPFFFSPREIEAYARAAYMTAKKNRLDFDKVATEISDANFRSNFEQFYPSEPRKFVQLFSFWRRVLKNYAKKHLYQQKPKIANMPPKARQTGNYKLSS